MAFEATPIMVDGRLYLSTPLNAVIALDPATGAEIWRYDPGIDRGRRYAEATSRGVSSWRDRRTDPDAPCAHRIFFGTLDGRLIALDGKSGRPCADFGDGGEIDLSRDVRLSEPGQYTITSPPAVINDTVITGSAIGDNRGVELGSASSVHSTRAAAGGCGGGTRSPAIRPTPPISAGNRGRRRAPAPRMPGPYYRWMRTGTWCSSQPARPARTSTAASGSATIDTPTPIVALRASTGQMVWHHQLVHHDLWDYDVSSEPVLVELGRNRQTVPAVIQATKMGLLFTFDPETGAPIFPIEERPVPQTAVAGEAPWPTQPFPVAPPPIVSHAPVAPVDAWGLILWDRWRCRKLIGGYRSEGIYTPPSLEGTIMSPGYAGGVSWGSLAFEPQRQLAIVNAMQVPMVVTLIPQAGPCPARS